MIPYGNGHEKGLYTVMFKYIANSRPIANIASEEVNVQPCCVLTLHL